jgi:hypothetical protein
VSAIASVVRLLVQGATFVDERRPLPAQDGDAAVEARDFALHLVDAAGQAGEHRIEVNQFVVSQFIVCSESGITPHMKQDE